MGTIMIAFSSFPVFSGLYFPLKIVIWSLFWLQSNTYQSSLGGSVAGKLTCNEQGIDFFTFWQTLFRALTLDGTWPGLTPAGPAWGPCWPAPFSCSWNVLSFFHGWSLLYQPHEFSSTGVFILFIVGTGTTWQFLEAIGASLPMPPPPTTNFICSGIFQGELWEVEGF